MIEGVNVHVKLTWLPAAFSIMRAAANIGEVPLPTYKIKQDEIALYMQKVPPSGMCHLAIIDTMKITPVKYQIHRVEMHSYSVSGCVTRWTQENIMLGQLPHRIVFCFTRKNAMHDDYLFHPLYLQHFNFNFLCCM